MLPTLALSLPPDGPLRARPLRPIHLWFLLKLELRVWRILLFPLIRVFAHLKFPSQLIPFSLQRLNSNCIFKSNVKRKVTLSQWTYFNWHTVTEIVVPKWRQSISTFFGPSWFVLFIYIQELQVFQIHHLVGYIVLRVYIILFSKLGHFWVWKGVLFIITFGNRCKPSLLQADPDEWSHNVTHKSISVLRAGMMFYFFL